MEALLDARADPNAVGHLRENGISKAVTPAQLALKRGHENIAKSLETYSDSQGMRNMSIGT